MLHEEQDVWEKVKVSVGAVHMTHLICFSPLTNEEWVEHEFAFDNIMPLCIPDCHLNLYDFSLKLDVSCVPIVFIVVVFDDYLHCNY